MSNPPDGHSSLVVKLVLIFLVCPGFAGVAAAQDAIGSPEISLASNDNLFEPNTETALNITVINQGKVVQDIDGKFGKKLTTARNVRLEVNDEEIMYINPGEGGYDPPIEVKSGEKGLGAVPVGQEGPVPFIIEIGDAKPGKYRIPFQVRYDATEEVNVGGGPIEDIEGSEKVFYRNTEVTKGKTVTIRIDDKPGFSIVSSETEDLFAGDVGVFNFSLKNTGSQPATDVTTELKTENPGVFFGSQENPEKKTSVYIPELQPGDSVNKQVDILSSPETDPGKYPISATVVYKDSKGVTKDSTRIPTSAEVSPGEKVELDLEAKSLSVNQNNATISGNLTNLGNSTMYNIDVIAETKSTVTLTSPESSAGNLSTGESAPVTFHATVPDGIQKGAREFRFEVEYNNKNGEVRKLGSPIRKSFMVGGKTDDFSVEDVSTNLNSGGSSEVNVTLKNRLNRHIEDVTAEIFVNHPLSSSDNQVFLGSMDPGETKQAKFLVSAGSNSINKTYPAKITVKYKENDDQTAFSKGIDLGIPVQEQEGGLPMEYLAGILVVVVVAAGIYLWKR
ncbi:MAG: hypothetical protein ABEK59_07215 [Halobacteria archaeon]